MFWQKKNPQPWIPLLLWLPSHPWPVWSMLTAQSTHPARLMRQCACWHLSVLMVVSQLHSVFQKLVSADQMIFQEQISPTNLCNAQICLHKIYGVKDAVMLHQHFCWNVTAYFSVQLLWWSPWFRAFCQMLLTLRASKVICASSALLWHKNVGEIDPWHTRTALLRRVETYMFYRNVNWKFETFYFKHIGCGANIFKA